MRISEVLDAKAHGGVVTIGAETGVRELLAVLAEHNVGALIVTADGTGAAGSPGTAGAAGIAGIVSERDIVRHLHSDGTVVDNTVGAIMTAVVETCESTSSLDEVMRTMTERHIRHVPVVDGGTLVGIVSIGDVVKHKMSQLEFERDQLDSYVHQT